MKSTQKEYEKRKTILENYIKRPEHLLKDTRELVDVVLEDAAKCIDTSSNNPKDPSWQRLVIRLAFSIIDSLCFKIKELYYCAVIINHFKLSKHDKEMLIGYEEKSDGRIVRCRSPLSLDVKYVLNLIATVLDSPPVYLGDKKWANFLDSIEIRHRITHPRNLTDLELSPAEYDLVASSYLWFTESIKGLLYVLPDYLNVCMIWKRPGARRPPVRDALEER